MLWFSSPRQVFGSWVDKRVLAIHLVQWLWSVFKNKERKKEPVCIPANWRASCVATNKNKKRICSSCNWRASSGYVAAKHTPQKKSIRLLHRLGLRNPGKKQRKGVPSGWSLPYYCTPPVTIPDVIGGLAVWQHINNQNKKRDSESRPNSMTPSIMYFSHMTLLQTTLKVGPKHLN